MIRFPKFWATRGKNFIGIEVKQNADAAFDKMAVRHGYYRKTDNPTQVLEKVQR